MEFVIVELIVRMVKCHVSMDCPPSRSVCARTHVCVVCVCCMCACVCVCVMGECCV